MGANGDPVSNSGGETLAAWCRQQNLTILNLSAKARGQFSRVEPKRSGVELSTVDYVLISESLNFVEAHRP